MSLKKYWTTKEGKEIPYKDITDSHLLNIIKWIEYNAEKGMIIAYYGGGWDTEYMWFEEEKLIEDEVKEHFHFKYLVKEALKRGLITDKEYLLIL